MTDDDTESKAEAKTYTPEEVVKMIEYERLKERTVSALLTAIQRSRAAGDDPIYTNALGGVLNDIVGVRPQQKPEEPKKEE